MYDYDRAATYEDTWLRWIEIEDGAPVFKYGTVYDAVFASIQWEDQYLLLNDQGNADPTDDELDYVSATGSGLNDFAAAADDSRAVIEFMHNYQAVEVDEGEVRAEFMPEMSVAKLSEITALPDDSHDDGHGDGHDDQDPEIIMGTNRPDNIEAGGGPQEIFGLNGGDVIHAGAGPDKVYGGNGADHLFGGGGPDMLDGGNGSDTLEGGHGMDTLTGGNGPDTFVFASPQDLQCHAECGDGRRETITDFDPEADVIDFRMLHLDGFSTEPQPHHAWIEQAGEDSVVYADTNGSLTGEYPAEMGILLTGLDADLLSAEHFLF